MDETHALSHEKQPLLETLGLDPVPTSLKTTGWIQFFMIQASFAVNSGNFIVPALAVLEGGLPFGAALLSVMLGAGLAFLLVSFLTLPGSKYGLPSQYALRAIFGTRFSRFLASPIRTLVSLYWFSVQTIGGTFVIMEIFKRTLNVHLPYLQIALILSSIMVILSLIGFEAVKKATRLFMPVLLIGQICMLAIFIQGTSVHSLSGITSKGDFSWTAFVFYSSLAFVQYVAGVSSSSDVARYGKTPRHAFWGMYAGNVFGFFMTALLAIFCALLTEKNNPFIEVIKLGTNGITLVLVACCAVVSMISINLNNAYTGGFSLLNTFPSLGRIKSTLIFGLFCILLSSIPMMVSEAKMYISILGSMVIPLSSIIVTDFLCNKKRSFTNEDLHGLSSGIFNYNVKGAYSLAFGVIMYLLIPSEYSPGFICFVITGLLYFYLTKESVIE